VEDVKIRVYMRSRVGTTLLWNTDVLTEEQKKFWILEARLSGGEPWFRPKVCAPIIKGPLEAMLKDGNTDGIMIPHQVTGRIDEKVGFEARILFGEPPSRESTIKVEPLHSYVPYQKPQRIEVDQRVVYAEPIYVAGVAKDVIDQIADAVFNKLKQR
jgi:hypothetical protein